MNTKKLLTSAVIVTGGLLIIWGSFALAEPAGETKPAAAPEMKLPPGWTAADLQACMIAGTPGKMHAYLAKSVGAWQGKTMMWMFPGADPMTSDSVSTCKLILDGRFVQCEMTGDMPGMGPYHGLGIFGYDNVGDTFVSTWMDNHSTGMMNGVGTLSDDGKTLTWKYSFNCPLTRKPAVMREVETLTGENSKTLEMFGTDPKSGKEFQMMRIELTRE